MSSLNPRPGEYNGPRSDHSPETIIALQQDAKWGDGGSVGPFGVQHCTWSLLGLRIFVPHYTHANKSSWELAKEKSRDGCLTAPPPGPSHGPSQPTEVGHGMEIIAKKPKHKGT